MSEKKDNNKEKTRPRHSAFEAPIYGTIHPKGTKIRRLPDGLIELIEPGDGRDEDE